MADQFGAPQGAYPPPPAGQPYGYPPPPAKTPGPAVAAAVLAYVQAGLVFIAAGVLMFFNDLANSFGGDGGILILLALINLVLVGLLIFGGVRLNTGKDRNILLVAYLGSLAVSVFWIVRLVEAISITTEASSGWWIIILLTVLPVIGLPMLLNSNVAQWLAAKRGM